MNHRAAFIVRGAENDILEICDILKRQATGRGPCDCFNAGHTSKGLVIGFVENTPDSPALSALVNLCDPYDVELFVVSEHGRTDDDYGIMDNSSPDPDWDKER